MGPPVSFPPLADLSLFGVTAGSAQYLAIGHSIEEIPWGCAGSLA